MKHVVIAILHGELTVVPEEPVRISWSRFEEVCWHCWQGDAYVEFEDSPFQDKGSFVVRSESHAPSAPASRTGRFKYSVTVRIPGDRREHRIDSEVIVED